MTRLARRRPGAPECWYTVNVSDDQVVSTDDPAQALDQFVTLAKKHSCVSLARRPDGDYLALQHREAAHSGTYNRWANVELLTDLGLPTVLWAQSELNFEE